MSIEAALYTLITSDVALAALVGTRVYPLVIPQETCLDATAMAYQVISSMPEYAHAEGDVYLDRVRVQLSFQAGSYGALKTAMAAVRSLLSGYSGTVNGTDHLQAVFWEARDDYAPTFERPTGRADLTIWYRDLS